MLSLALGWAEVLDAREIHVGVECHRLFGLSGLPAGVHRGFENLARLATRAGVEGQSIAIRAPLLHMSKAKIVREGARLEVDYSITVSCYQADARGLACGLCDSCKLRREGFVSAGVFRPHALCPRRPTDRVDCAPCERPGW
jgi:7-cyano-7-deazaguanine synthase